MTGERAVGEVPVGPAADARLRGLRLHGFKSFAERTVLEFGPGISVVVGPNGSGKSNLADGLRWALGEQGRSLRIRRSEDVIWAGSERRAAQGMADVTLVIDNADRLLPVDYGEIELGRRLYRSGENEYLLNRQRVRLRDLVDLLDAAHLADNAFLFIGQGMVDQALALRPEERRPLFEEVAGVRRHERRRRRAEEQLAESEVNLARVDDIIAELRPQARRLATQAEQQATRETAGEELARAVVLHAHARWHEAAARARTTADRRAAAERSAADAVRRLEAAEEAAAAIAVELDAGASGSSEREAAHDAARAALEAARLQDARLSAEGAALERDRERLAAERDAALAAALAERRALALPVPERDLEAEASLAEADRGLAEALAELGALRAAARAGDEQRAAVRRAAAARAVEIETARRRVADAERRAAEEAGAAAAAEARRSELESEAARARAAADAALAAEAAAIADREARRAAAALADAVVAEATSAAAGDRERAASVAARLEALTARIAEEEARGIARAARRVGGRRVDEELVVESGLRAAVERVLGERARGYVVSRDAVAQVATERGQLVVADALAPARTAAGDEADRRGAAVRDRARELGGGDLSAAIRRDPLGAGLALVARAVWVPDLDAALRLQPSLPPGWLAVTRDGTALVDGVSVAVGAADDLLERRAEAGRLEAALGELRAHVADRERALADAAARATDAQRALAEASARAAHASEARRAAEDAVRLAERNLEASVREASWHAAQAERLTAEAERARAGLVDLDSGRASDADVPGSPDAPTGAADTDGLRAWEERAAALRERRDRIAARVAEHEATRRAAEAAKARAETTAGIATARAQSADSQLVELDARGRTLTDEAGRMTRELAVAEAAVAAARAAVDEQRAADADARDRLRSAEAAVHRQREAVRAADEALRGADVADLEARLGLESLREAVLVDLAALGEIGLRALGLEPGDDRGEGRAGIDGGGDGVEGEGDLGDGERKALEAAVAAAAAGWAETSPATDPPSDARLTTLRRRYHELGAGNPFAAEEYAEVRERLVALEGQARDLREAIGRTRRLIEELETMIAGQFAATFRALETTFDARFRHLFGGGFAKLSLTDPDDLGSTGVEIVARPPGKKPQALAMLSGGERALTAVALLFAMLEVRPVPFCVLDEVDAALDEANVGRFTEALRGLAGRIQFVVITHNRGTIEAADALYGVTVGDDSVSRVISLRLEEAREIAARRRAQQPVAVGA
ncbi:MAG TPA: chromosome segregation protein SMC [Candidatus Limnocylindrales bacterium]|nr:chromosome segregation protein SMC [Candidatus Limnocylindrales bacterium]